VLVGRKVFVTVGVANSGYVAAVFRGLLRLAEAADLAELTTELEGEELWFVVGSREPVATFTVWSGGFEWGARIDGDRGVGVLFCVCGVVTHVEPR
jgi:hypothetical protein